MAILFDLDGVFYRGDRAIPGAAAVAEWARARAIPHLYLTNTTSRTRAALRDKLAALGIATDVGHILPPPVAAVAWCRRHLAQRPVALFVAEQTRAEFAELPAYRDGGEVGAVIVGDLGEGWTFARLNEAFRLLMRRPPPVLIALGMTRYWQAADGLRLDVAPFVMALAHAADLQPVVLGKPAAAFFATAVELLGPAVGPRVVMVGDDIRGDVAAAQQAGLSGVLVRTGKFRETDLQLGIAPDAVLESIADLPAWYEHEFEPGH